MMALGTLLFGIGLGMYGLVGIYPLFIVAMAILTVGEMVAIPIANVVELLRPGGDARAL